ncbi:MAG: CPBP family intramembrane glutamic endopeptidase [Pseudoxanthomonas sp.]
MSTCPLRCPASTRLMDSKIALILGVLAGLSVAAVFPYMAELMPERFAALPLPLGLVVLIQGLQSAVMIGLLAWLGLRMGHRVGLGSPLLHAWLGGAPTPGWNRLKPVHASVLGIAVALLITALATLSDPLLPAARHGKATPQPSALSGLLASFYGGIAEELLLRLFLVTLCVWLLSGFGKRAPAPWKFWGAIVFCALLFGIGHLPPAVDLWGFNTVVLMRTLLLNGLAGVTFGWLYWRRGLEMAMLAHFSADLVLHVLAPLVMPTP